MSLRYPKSRFPIGIIIIDELLTLSTASLVCINLYCMGVIVGQMGAETEEGTLHYIEFPIPTSPAQVESLDYRHRFSTVLYCTPVQYSSLLHC